MLKLWSVILVCCCAPVAWGDIITLVSGETRDGRIIEETKEYIRLEMAFGTLKGVVRIERADILSVKKGVSQNDLLMAEYKERKGSLSRADKDGWLALAKWCA